MYLKQSDLFWQLDHDFVKRIMEQAQKQKWEAGHILFHEGDPARRFYILIKGRVRLNIGQQGQVVNTVNHAGECFGWSALLNRDVYSASAECKETTELLSFEEEHLSPILEDDPANGLVFMKRLAGMIGNRLIQNYQLVASMQTAEGTLVFGANQLVESAADI